MPFDIISLGDNRYSIIFIKLQMVTNRSTLFRKQILT